MPAGSGVASVSSRSWVVGVHHVDEGRPAEGAAPGEIEVVLDHHDGAGGEVVPDAADGGGEDDRRAAGGDAGAQRVNGLGRPDPLVEVAPPAQDQHLAPLHRQRPAVRSVPGRRVGREGGERVEREEVLSGAEELGRSREAAAQDHQHVVVVGPDATGQLVGAPRRQIVGVVHEPAW